MGLQSKRNCGFKDMKNFEEYLKTLHAEQYEGVDDDMPDDYEHWLMKFDTNDILKMIKDYEWNYARPIAGKDKI